MSPRRVPAATGDLFWDTVLRGHPDLELVLLPPQQRRPAPQTRPRLDPATVQAVRGALRAAVDAVLARVGVDVGASAAELVERLVAGASSDSLSVHVRRVVPGGADEASPREVLDVLREDRWDVSDHPGAVHRVVASRTDLPAGRGGARVGLTVVLALDRTTGSLEIEAGTGDLPVGEDVAGALLDAQHGGSDQAPGAGKDHG